MHIVQVSMKVTMFIFAQCAASLRVERVMKGGIIWVVPIHQGVIKPNPQSFCTKSVQILAHKVASNRSES